MVHYDRDHADESKPGNFPLGLIADGELVGTIRIDLLDETRAALRLVAIHPDRQGQGLGAAMLRLAEDFIRLNGRRRIVVTANVAERDIHTPTGQQLTLVNPAYMTRQVF